MPRYEFFCETCGTFEQWRDHRESGEPMPCPSCKVVAKRIYSAPGVKVRNETRRPSDQGPKAGIVERPDSSGSPQSTKPQRVGGRPWQISH